MKKVKAVMVGLRDDAVSNIHKACEREYGLQVETSRSADVEAAYKESSEPEPRVGGEEYRSCGRWGPVAHCEGVDRSVE